jgi:pyruvate,water dikinase
VRPTPLIDAADESRFGGKAAALARMLKAALPVPPGFALATAAVEAVHAGDAATLDRLRADFRALGGPCAVRSSAVGEDSATASFAGQHVTVLNVRREDEIVPAVLEVRASAFTSSAREYRHAVGLDDTPRIGVVVQRMIEPDCAGVLFTRNPVTAAEERVIEASWGLGEAVVGGLVVPDNYVVGVDGRVVRRTPGEKDVALRSRPEGGAAEVAVDPDLVHALCLTDAMLARLHELASACEAHFGRALDIEWAFAGPTLYLLQYRAITRER